ncbi:MAG TPA: hypothetical protein VHG30_00355 [Microvirga sp.]|nr:hypothetical protein [Microvirga sp.]
MKCASPPVGRSGPDGKPVGVKVGMAKQIGAYALGSPDNAEPSCVATDARIPSLTGGKIDIVIGLPIRPRGSRTWCRGSRQRCGSAASGSCSHARSVPSARRCARAGSDLPQALSRLTSSSSAARPVAHGPRAAHMARVAGGRYGRRDAKTI